MSDVDKKDPLRDFDDYKRACVRVDPMDIQSEFVRISADLAYWNERYADALRAYLMAEMDVGVLKGQLDPMIRHEVVSAGGKVTESMVASMIATDTSVVAAKQRVIDTEVEKNRMYGVIDSIRTKKDMLVSLGAHLRAEIQGDPMLRDQLKFRHDKDRNE